MDTATDALRDAIAEACVLLGRFETSGGHDANVLTQLDLLRFELLSGADAAADTEAVHDACEVVVQINEILDRTRVVTRVAAKAS